MNISTQEKKAELGVGLLGLGVIGSGIATAILQKADLIQEHVGMPLVIRKVLVRNPERPTALGFRPDIVTTDPKQVLENPSIAIVIEAIGGEYPALQFIKQALNHGKHVATANKEVIAKHGPEIMAMAADKGLHVLFEATVGGGIPIVGPLLKDLAANKITAIYAIINGTTNYILTQMSNEQVDVTTALEQAQQLGYAEPDPTNDIEGIDATYKLAILATLAFRTRIHPSQIYCQGITLLDAKDFQYAKELGYTIKLLAIASEEAGAIQLRVHPALVPQEHLLSKVNGVFNAVEIQGDLVQQVVFHGRGAGAVPTSSALMANLLEIGSNIVARVTPAPYPTLRTGSIRPIADLRTCYYLRILVDDRPGVLHQIASIFAELQISIASVIQKETDVQTNTAEIVITTHPSLEASIQESLLRFDALDSVKRVGNCIRVENIPD